MVARRWFSGVAAVAALVSLNGCSSKSGNPAAAGAETAKKDFAIGWSIYTGWMPWPYAQQAGIVKKWADKYGINIRLVQVNDYVDSVN